MPFAAPRRSADPPLSSFADLPWDSEFFGCASLRCCRIGCRRTIWRRSSNAGATGIRLRVFPRRPGGCAGLGRVSAAGWRFVDVRVTLERSLDPRRMARSTPTARVTPRPVTCRRCAASLVSHADSRFYQDGRFSRAACDRLFEEWIAKSVAGELADAVLVSGSPGAPLGYLTLRAGDEAEASIGLFAVTPAARGRGLGSGLLAAGLEWARAQGCSAISVVTQGSNVGAQRVYQRAGFTTRDAAYWYHAWR